jgi:type IV fimbrial biogenesis protein FimT
MPHRKRPEHVSLVAAGFTLIELLITIAITAILLRIAVPSFSSAFLSSRLSSYSNSFVASAQLARGEALKRNATVTLCRSANQSTCATSGGWQQGWIVRAADGTVIQAEQALSSDYRFTGDAYSISFLSSGLSSTPATLTLCRATPSAGSQERQVVLSATGKASVTKTAAGVCS